MFIAVIQDSDNPFQNSSNLISSLCASCPLLHFFFPLSKKPKLVGSNGKIFKFNLHYKLKMLIDLYSTIPVNTFKNKEKINLTFN